MSSSNPQMKPIHMPSLLPRMNPKEDTRTTSRFGEIFAKARVENSVFCSKKHRIIINNTVILRLIPILSSLCGLLLLENNQNLLQMLKIHSRRNGP